MSRMPDIGDAGRRALRLFGGGSPSALCRAFSCRRRGFPGGRHRGGGASARGAISGL